ncbi:intermediate filament protein [Plakobranchus ocellatus]|uniref:Intermediate filament protein n=1 Tax=Plakobranchus ocellatus TaxID=259542 RepID=A0AAV3ZZ29_9GAST|nr:intermediate filament protein [Plakobranchus ocellatus]
MAILKLSPWKISLSVLSALRQSRGCEKYQYLRQEENVGSLRILRGMLDELKALEKAGGIEHKQSIQTYENQAKDFRKKIESLTNQIGEYEGELHTLRLRVGSLEDENAKVREILEKVQDQNRRLRSDLDTETAAHIEADCLAQTKSEEAEFYKDLLDQLELMKPEPITIKGMDYADFWKSELAKAIREINAAYDEKIDMIQQDCEAKYSAQINSLRAGNVKDGMQLNHAQEEVKRLRGQLQDKNSAYAEMGTKIASLQAERDELARQLAEMERELETQRLKYNQDVGDLESELSSVLSQLQNLMDAKMSLELEIACYKKLLEGEESRVGLRSLVEQAIGTQSKGGATLKEIVQQSSLKESTGSLTVQRSSKGAIGFASIDHSGGNVVIENTTSGARAKSQNIRGWHLLKTVSGRTTVDIVLKDFELNSGRSFTVWAKGAKDKATADNEQISDSFSFGVGTSIWKLLDDAGNEKATLKAQFSG